MSSGGKEELSEDRVRVERAKPPKAQGGPLGLECQISSKFACLRCNERGWIDEREGFVSELRSWLC